MGHYVTPPLQEDYPTSPPPKTTTSNEPPCDSDTGIGLDAGLDIDLGSLLSRSALVDADLGGTSIAINNPTASDCTDAQTGALIDVDVTDLPLSILDDGSMAGLARVALDDSTVKVANPLATGSTGNDTALIDINAQNLPVVGDASDDGGTLLAGILGSGDGATGLLSGLLSTGGSGTDGCGDSDIGGILQPVVDLVFDPVDGLLA
jgi:hypothetical protein